MDGLEFALENLKDAELRGYLIFTDAAETGEEVGGTAIITSNTKPGVDVALIKAGFYFTLEGDHPSSGMYWMKRTGKENLRYHPVSEKTSVFAKAALARGMKTRIDFFCNEKGNAAYDVVSELLKLGYKVLLFSPHSRLIKKWFLLEQKGAAVSVEEAE